MNMNVHDYNADGSGRHEVTDRVVNTHFLSWSPDGRRIAFYSDDITVHDGDDVYVVNVYGTNLLNLTEQHPPAQTDAPGGLKMELKLSSKLTAMATRRFTS